MKLFAILDHRMANKTFLGVAERLRQRGHEVHVDMYYDIEQVKWCDAIWCEYVQGGAVEAFNENHGKPLFARGIDIDLYFGHYLGLDLNKAKAIVFINDYIRKMIVENYESARTKLTTQIETIKLGIDLDKFTPITTPPVKVVGWLNEFWYGKGVELLAQVINYVIKADPEFRFELCGHCAEPWLDKYFKEFLRRNDLVGHVHHVERVNDVNEWMDGLGVILSTSMKECMSLPMVEGMAKGIRPCVHNWWGAEEMFPQEFVWNSVGEATNQILGFNKDFSQCRQFVADNYNLDRETDQIEQLILKNI